MKVLCNLYKKKMPTYKSLLEQSKHVHIEGDAHNTIRSFFLFVALCK